MLWVLVLVGALVLERCNVLNFDHQAALLERSSGSMMEGLAVYVQFNCLLLASCDITEAPNKVPLPRGIKVAS